MIVQAATRHEFIHQKPVVILQAITNQLHKIRMSELSKIVDFCL